MMTPYELFLSATITGFEILLCILVYRRNLQRRLPFFSAYAAVILASCLSQVFVFTYYGFRSAISYYFAWISYFVVMLARSAAIAELCGDCLKAYQGIWALTWRLLGLMSVFLFVHAAIDAQGQPNWFAAYGLTIERDVDIASFLILATMLLIGKYYRLRIELLQQWIAIGICFYCLIEFANSTVLRNLFSQYMSSWASMKSEVDRVNELWNTVYITASCITIGNWCFLLRKPLPETAKQEVLLPAEIYQELSPEINLRLRAFNERLLEMLKP